MNNKQQRSRPEDTSQLTRLTPQTEPVLVGDQVHAATAGEDAGTGTQERPVQYTLRLGTDEADQLDAVTRQLRRKLDRRGVSVAEVLRGLVAELDADDKLVERLTDRLTLRSEPVRITVDLAPSAHAQLVRWCTEAAKELGRARVSQSEVVRALLEEIAVNSELDAAIRARLDR